MNKISSLDFKKYRKIDYPNVTINRYIISEYGDVFDTLKQRMLSQYSDKDGYKKVHINGHNIFVHRLVAWAFYPDTRSMNLVIDHIDGKKDNNYYKNLEWVTVKENTLRAQRNGLRKVRGENSSTNKYPEELVHTICQLFVKGKNNMEVFRLISNKDRIDMNKLEDRSLYLLISHVRHKDIWPDVVEKYTYPMNSKSEITFYPKEGSRLNENQVHTVCRLGQSGMKAKYIATELGISENDPELHLYLDSIRSILRGKVWVSISKNYNLPETKRHRHYNIDDNILTELLCKGYNRDMIMEAFGVDKSNEGKLLRRAINKRICNFNKNRNIVNNTDIILSDNDIINLENWAAQW